MTDSIIKILVGISLGLFVLAGVLMLPGCSDLPHTSTQMTAAKPAQQNSATTATNYATQTEVRSKNADQVTESYDAQVRSQQTCSDGYGNAFKVGGTN